MVAINKIKFYSNKFLLQRKDKADIVAKEADVIAKQGDLVYKKLIILVAIAGGTWLFGMKANGIENYFF